MKQDGIGTALPFNNHTYQASGFFGKGPQIDSSGWFCVYNGKDSSVLVSGLDSGKDYIAKIFEYSGREGFETYLIPKSDNNPKAFNE
ncbi:MAG: hypothetical protein JNK09_14660 [Prolixibacteraceae bacterium]|nr:hypothetical protein [Prolixibacteraceae bacterium]